MRPQILTDPAVATRKHPALVRVLLILLAVLLLGFLGCWRLLLPQSPRSLPSGLTERDQKQITALCRRHTVDYAVDKFRRGEFGWFFRSTQVLFQQKIDRLSDNRDGTYRVYVVVYDKQAPDGFNPWIRHQVVKTNGHWMILRSY